ncbi:uncharacterized protein METZ01_LOCUS424340 [marine metagenome]|uniref:Uncharacterized protein n=1 Tax=marine metagenome TaxID=408172 RepID=A0A382XK27_9ZZZZ
MPLVFLPTKLRVGKVLFRMNGG